METIQKNKFDSRITSSHLTAFVQQLIDNGIPHPENPEPDPWRSLIQLTISQTISSLNQNSMPGFLLTVFANSYSQVWDGLKSNSSLLQVALNPQPLPPRMQFAYCLSQQLTDRAQMMMDITTGISDEQHAIIIVGGYVNKFVDDICPIPPRILIPTDPCWWLRLPKPPKPGPDPDPYWTALELTMVGVGLLNNAKYIPNENFRNVLVEAGNKINQEALGRA